MHLLAAISTGDAAILVAVVGARLVIPLFIPRFPLPAIIAALVLDAADQSIFQQATDLDLTGYQSYDKALDVYYLAIAYTSVMRNWASPFMHSVAAFLWYYRLVGVAAFELTEQRWMLLVFANTFEYFFIAIELVRTRWNPARLARRTVVLIAAAIWIFIKLPQEYWIHVAQLDTTDLIKEDILGVPADTPWGEAFAENPWAYGVLVLLAVVVIVAIRVLRRHLPPGDWPTTVRSDDVAEHVGWLPTAPAPRPEFFGWALFEKVGLAGLCSVIFFTIYPDSDANAIQVFVVVALTVVVNAAVSWFRDRLGGEARTIVGLFTAALVINLAALWVFANLFTGDDVTVSLRDVAFFAYLIAVLVTLFDTSYRHRARCREAEPATVAADGR